VFNLPQTRHCDFTIRCKKCGENIPAPVGTMPDSWIAAQCPLCGEKRNYLPSEIFQGKSLVQTWSQTGAIRGALMGEMKRAIARERVAWAEQMQEQTRMKSTLVIAAAIIAAVRLARDPDISRPSPRLTAVVSDSVNLARMILDRVGRQ
jgi:hypothetical protein